jgi:hypothetical protein
MHSSAISIVVIERVGATGAIEVIGTLNRLRIIMMRATQLLSFPIHGPSFPSSQFEEDDVYYYNQ